MPDDLEGDVHVVLDHEHRHRGVQALDEARHHLRLGGGKAGGGLVEEEDAWAAGERERDLELALLAVREVLHDGARAIGEADGLEGRARVDVDRKSTRLNSSHLGISYAVFCLKKKKQKLRSSARRTSVS